MATSQRMAPATQPVPVDYAPVQYAGGGDETDLEERELVERARTDQAAFAELYGRYFDRIYAFAYRRTQTRHVAEDITSATFERAYRMLDRFEWRGGGFKAWIYRIASNELADHYRRQGRSQSERGQAALGQLYSSSSEDDLERVEWGEEQVRLLLAALDTLHGRYAEAISLRYLSGLSHEEAAAAMGIAKPVMAVTLSRALKALKKAMVKLMDEGPQ